MTSRDYTSETGGSKSNSMEELEKSLREILREIEELSVIKDDDEDDSHDEQDYQSCIRVRGRPILPPLMTPGKYGVFFQFCFEHCVVCGTFNENT